MVDEIDYAVLPRQEILCIDMRSFFASIEAVAHGLDPLKACIVVIGDKKRSGAVVLAASPMMKEKYKIGTASRFFEVPDNPEIQVIEARMGLYLERSLEITRLYNEYVPLEAIHVYSIDEAWLKLDGTRRLFGDSRRVAGMIREELLKRFKLPSSMGLGPNMFLAKVAMDVEGKKKGLAQWTYEDVPEKLWPVKLKDCWGIGGRLARQFKRIGVTTVGQLARLPLEYLEKRYGIMGTQLHYHAWGVDLSKVEGHYRNKARSLGKGITLLRDYTEVEEIKTVIFELAEAVARRARKNKLAGKTVNFGLVYSREEARGGFYYQRTMKNYTNLAADIFQTALELLDENYQGEVVRKVNLALSNLVPDSMVRLELFRDRVREVNLSRVGDELHERFGYQALFYGRSLKKGSIKKKIETTIGGHKA